MPEPETTWILLARLLRPQGRKGELLAALLTDFPDRFQPSTEVFLAPSSSTPEEAARMEVVSSWLPLGRNQGRIVLGFAGVDSIEKAERLLGLDVVVPETDRNALTDDRVYISNLIGCILYDKDLRVGTVTDVQFMTTADGKRRLDDAAPLLTIDLEDGEEALIPFAKSLLLSMDLRAKEISMNLPDGLLALNRSPADLPST